MLYYSKDDKRSTAVAILRRLLRQLLQRKQRLEKYAHDDFKGVNAGTRTVSSLGTLWRIFTSMLQDRDLGSVVCVLDGPCEWKFQAPGPESGPLDKHQSSALWI